MLEKKVWNVDEVENKEVSDDIQNFLDALLEPVVLVESETRVIAALNAVAADLFRMPAAEMVNRQCHRFICPAEKGKCPILDLGMVVDHSRRDILLEGQERLAVIKTVKPVFLQGREYLLETIEPMSEDPESLLTRVQRAELYRSLFYDNHAVMLIVDPDSGSILEANNAAALFYGYGVEDLRQMNITDINQLAREQVLTEMGMAKARKRNSFLFPHRLASGEIRQVRVFSGLVQWEGKEALYSIVHDETEKERSTTALAEKTAELDQLFENAPFAIFLCDGNRKILRANGKASEMFGYGEEEMTGKTTEELLVPEEDQKQGWAYSDGVYLERKVQRFEAERKRKDGSRLFVHCIGFPLVLAGNTQGSYVIYQDITEYRRSLEMLEASEQKFRSIFEESAAPMLLLLPENGEILSVNRAAEKFYGYTKEKFLKLNHSDINPQDLEKLRQERMKVAKGIKRHFRTQHRLANGKVRDVEIFGSLVELEDGNVIFSIIQDVTARTRAESLLKRERAYLDSLFEMAPDAVVVTDEHGHVMRVNRSFLKLFGYMSHDCVGRKLDPLVTGQDSTVAKEAAVLTEKIRAGRAVAIETARVKKSGDVFPCRIITVPMIFEDGTHGGYVLYHDLTEERAREGQLSITNEIMKNSPVILFRWPNESGGHVLYASENVSQWGYSPEEVTSESFSYYRDLIHPDDRDRIRERTRDNVAGGREDFELEYRVRKAEGDWIWVSDKTRVVRDGNGKPLYQEGIVIDITERKRTEELAKAANESLRRHAAEMGKAFEQTISVLATTAEAKDPYTAGHQRKVAKLSGAIAEALGMGMEDTRKVELAALVHDIGKIEVPAEILVKPGKLSSMEFELIKIHPTVGYRILKGIETPWPLAEIVYQHHERMDGTGYPRKLKGEEILLEARIISVADTVEAMASHRPYRPALGIDAALAELSGQRGRTYDPEVVDACLRLFHEMGFKFEEN